MRSLIALGSVCLMPAVAQKTSPFVGRWDFNTGPQRANWLGVTEKDGTLEVWFQPNGKNPGMSWELDAAGDKLTGVQKRGDNSLPLAGIRAPELKRDPPAAWTDPEPLFNGKDLTGWEPTDPAQNHWLVENGDLVNTTRGANLRGRYEVQLEYEPLEKNPPERRIGSIYGFIAPAVTVPRKFGTWESLDITLVGRIVTIVHDGILTIDHKEIPGITGGALDANEGEPGTFYIQGDHTAGLRFRNIKVSVPKR